MSTFTNKHWIAAGIALAAAILLYAAPRVVKESPETAEEVPMDGLAELAGKARSFLPDSLQKAEKQWLAMADEGGAPAAVANDSLSSFWLQQGQPAIAAFYAEKSAAAGSDPEQWKDAADLFLLAARNTQDDSRQQLYSTAIRCFETAFDKGHHSLDSRVDLGSCYVEGSRDPMKGIGIIREVLEADSTNVRAQLSLGYFSIRSGQHDKAIERFRKVLELDPEFHDAHVYLGDLYERTGQTEAAILHYEEFKKHVEDPVIATRIDDYLKKLRSN